MSSVEAHNSSQPSRILNSARYKEVIDQICNWNWPLLAKEELIDVAWAYYYFSIQFRECLEIARRLYPDDVNLIELDNGERDTDNLSPWPGVAEVGEKMNHDEFMRRTLQLANFATGREQCLRSIGNTYLAKSRMLDGTTKALALASYEDGGLEKVFGAILTAPDWDGPLLEAFRHFLTEHIRFDSDPEKGHGALCRHLPPDERVLPLWTAFKDMLLEAAPSLSSIVRAS
jgi:hypothetical protein